ncbi:hypothetical protein KAW65_01610 [candidate division WOR-3 bacterium]|nr:hypothetical protein [candidate division WOR-3 bacterium]
MNKYIKEAKRYYQIALKEIEESSKNGNPAHNLCAGEMAVDGCEKGWLSLNLAIKAMFLKKGAGENKLPKDYRGMRFFLKKYGDRDSRKMFNSAFRILHIDGFWERDVDYGEAFTVLEDVKEYIKKIENDN